MLRSAKGLVGFTIAARDGDLGRVEALYFDDQRWTGRYFAVDTSPWLTGRRRMLVSPSSVRSPDWERRRLPVALTKGQVQSGPDMEAHRAISRQFEAAFAEYYGIPPYWSTPYAGAEDGLRSTEEVRGYHLRATDGGFGHVEDFLVEDLTWRIRYLDVGTRSWWPSRRVLIAPEWIEDVSWQRSAVFVGLPGDTILNAPPFDPSRPVGREYEQNLYAYYGHTGYWQERAAA